MKHLLVAVISLGSWVQAAGLGAALLFLPTISPPGGPCTGTVQITITPGDTSDTVYYTTNGEDPHRYHNRYEYGFSIPVSYTKPTIVVKARAYNNSDTSEVAEETYTYLHIPQFTTVKIAPYEIGVMPESTVQFSAAAYDQVGLLMPQQPGFTWGISGAQVISDSGLYTAGPGEGGPFQVSATGMIDSVEKTGFATLYIFDPGRAVRELTGMPTRLVWSEHQGDGNDFFNTETEYLLMGLDTEDGQGIRPILREQGSYCKPLITPVSQKIIFTDRSRDSVYMVNWDGSGRQGITDGYATDVWLDPLTHQEWVYVGKTINNAYRPLYRYLLEDPYSRTLVWDTTPLGSSFGMFFSISSDGKRAAAAFPHPQCGLADLETGSWRYSRNGCWPSIAPDNSYTMWVLDYLHRSVHIFGAQGSYAGEVSIDNAPGILGWEVHTPRWSNHKRYITMVGPNTDGQEGACVSHNCGNLVQAGRGGQRPELYIGKFDDEYIYMTDWVRVTINRKAAFFGDAWIEPQPEISLSPTYLEFFVQPGSAYPGSKAIQVCPLGGAQWDSLTISDDADWLEITTRDTGYCTVLENRVDAAGLSAGGYSAAVEIQAGSLAQQYQVALTVGLDWYDDFNDGDLNGWVVGDGTWQVTDGQLRNSGNSRNTIWGGLYDWRDIEYTAEITPVPGMDIWMIFRIHDKDNLYLFTLGLTGLLWKIENGNLTRLGASNGAVAFLPESTYTMQVTLKGDSITVAANDTDLISLTDTTFRNGYVGLGSNGGCRALFDNVSVVCQSTGIGTYKSPLPGPVEKGFNIISSLGQNSITFSFYLPEPDHVSLQIFSQVGKELVTIISGEYPAGGHKVSWQGQDTRNKALNNGLYFCRMAAGNSYHTRPFVFIKN